MLANNQMGVGDSERSEILNNFFINKTTGEKIYIWKIDEVTCVTC